MLRFVIAGQPCLTAKSAPINQPGICCIGPYHFQSQTLPSPFLKLPQVLSKGPCPSLHCRGNNLDASKVRTYHRHVDLHAVIHPRPRHRHHHPYPCASVASRLGKSKVTSPHHSTRHRDMPTPEHCPSLPAAPLPSTFDLQSSSQQHRYTFVSPSLLLSLLFSSTLLPLSRLTMPTSSTDPPHR